MARIPRYTGVDADGVAETEADHFMECPAAGNGSICATWTKCCRMFTTRRLRCAAFPSCR
jgi:hypothetical protein